MKLPWIRRISGLPAPGRARISSVSPLRAPYSFQGILKVLPIVNDFYTPPLFYTDEFEDASIEGKDSCKISQTRNQVLDTQCFKVTGEGQCNERGA